MEELLPIIISVAIASLAISKATSRRKKAGSKGTPSEDTEAPMPKWLKMLLPEDDSTQTPFPTPTTRPRPAATAATSHMDDANSDFGVEGQSTVRKIEMQAPNRQTSAGAKHSPVATGKPSDSGKREKKEVSAIQETANNDQQAEIAEDFDLRKAVIYSEIMKAKFDEE